MIREIEIADCVHYCGFRYGRDEFNPYENYIVGLAAGHPLEELRRRFIDFLIHYRPPSLSEALGADLERPVPLWLLPWKSWRKLFRPGGWQACSSDLLDILTYFSPRGIESHRIEEEFGWLERALDIIRNQGYRPEQHSFIEVYELRGTLESRFLVVDGNHRLCALHAIGERRVLVRQPVFSRARRNCARFWPLVLSGHVSYRDALVIFDSYFRGNLFPYRAAFPAPLLD